MGNVLSAHMTNDLRQSGDKVVQKDFWDNGSLLGKFIEDTLIKDTNVEEDNKKSRELRKRACCMGLSKDNRNKRTHPERGLKVPIANIGINNYPKIKDGDNFATLTNKSIEDVIKNPGEDLSKLPQKARPKNLSLYNKHKAAYNQHGMIIKKLRFPSLDDKMCTMNPDEYEGRGANKSLYESYAKSKKIDSNGESNVGTGDANICNTFYKKYANKKISERNCFVKNEKNEWIVDRDKPGCRDSFKYDNKTYYDLVVTKADTAARYPEELSCLLSPYSELVNEDPPNNFDGLGKIYGVSTPARTNPKLSDTFCVNRIHSAYDANQSEAYLTKKQRTNNNICLQDITLKNISAGGNFTVKDNQMIANCGASSKKINVENVNTGLSATPDTQDTQDSQDSQDTPEPKDLDDSDPMVTNEEPNSRATNDLLAQNRKENERKASQIRDNNNTANDQNNQNNQNNKSEEKDESELSLILSKYKYYIGGGIVTFILIIILIIAMSR